MHRGLLWHRLIQSRFKFRETMAPLKSLKTCGEVQASDVELSYQCLLEVDLICEVVMFILFWAQVGCRREPQGRCLGIEDAWKLC